MDTFFDQNLVIVTKGFCYSTAELFVRTNLADTDGGTEVGRFDKEGQPQRSFYARKVDLARSAALKNQEFGDRQLGVSEQPFHHVLVHAHRGTKDSGADERNVGEFQNPLNGAVLAKGTVEHRKDHVHFSQPPTRGKYRCLCGSWQHGGGISAPLRLNLRLVAAMEKPRPFVKEPASLLVDADGNDLVFFLSIASTMFLAEITEISCSADFPPNRMATRFLFMSSRFQKISGPCFERTRIDEEED